MMEASIREAFPGKGRDELRVIAREVIQGEIARLHTKAQKRYLSGRDCSAIMAQIRDLRRAI